LIINGSDLESDFDSTVRTGVSLVIIIAFCYMIVYICYEFTRNWEDLKHHVGTKVLHNAMKDRVINL